MEPSWMERSLTTCRTLFFRGNRTRPVFEACRYKSLSIRMLTGGFVSQIGCFFAGHPLVAWASRPCSGASVKRRSVRRTSPCSHGALSPCCLRIVAPAPISRSGHESRQPRGHSGQGFVPSCPPIIHAPILPHATTPCPAKLSITDAKERVASSEKIKAVRRTTAASAVST